MPMDHAPSERRLGELTFVPEPWKGQLCASCTTIRSRGWFRVHCEHFWVVNVSKALLLQIARAIHGDSMGSYDSWKKVKDDVDQHLEVASQNFVLQLLGW